MKRLLILSSILPVLSPVALAAGDSHGPSWLPEFLSHPATNVAFFALVIFLLIMWRIGGFKALTGGLDKRADAIQAQLNEAKDLREAAAKLLADAERKQVQAEKDAAGIVDQAKKDAALLMADQRAALAAKLERREAIAEARISQAENEAAAEVRRAAADAATAAARDILVRSSDDDIFERAAQDIERAL
ncbi:MAG: ATP F0F1 synthase subunit B [Hyphomonadaceae bacterium]